MASILPKKSEKRWWTKNSMCWTSFWVPWNSYVTKLNNISEHISITVVLLQRNSKVELNNYRPTALQSCFSKIFEEIIFNRFTCYLEDISLLHNNQFGFIKSKSNVLASSHILDSFYKAIDNHEHVFGIFYELTKAFDCVNHSILLEKLNRLDFRGVANTLIESYHRLYLKFILSKI